MKRVFLVREKVHGAAKTVKEVALWNATTVTVQANCSVATATAQVCVATKHATIVVVRRLSAARHAKTTKDICSAAVAMVRAKTAVIIAEVLA